MARRCARLIIKPLFRHDPDIALRVLTTGMGGKAYRTLRPLLRVFPSFYRFRHRIRENNLERDRTIVAAALDRIEYERQNRAYLVGEAFTVADLTVAALLGALLQPPEIQYPLQVELPPYLKDYRAMLLRHPAAQWATACIAAPRKLPGVHRCASFIPSDCRHVISEPLPLMPDNYAQTALGEPCRIIVKDKPLRRWIKWCANDALSEGKIPNKNWYTSLPIPKDVKEAAALVDRIESDEAKAELETALGDLDEVVRVALGLTKEQRDYIINQISTVRLT